MQKQETYKYPFSCGHESEGFPGGPEVKNLPPKAGDETQVQSLGWGRSPRGGKGNALQYSCLENPMDTRAWQATVYGVTKSRT